MSRAGIAAPRASLTAATLDEVFETVEVSLHCQSSAPTMAPAFSVRLSGCHSI
jgi:hypothetical protein